MQNAGAIFLGNTPGPARAYLGGLLAALRRRYRRLGIPCCGKFAIAEVAINVGWSPDNIECSDVSLFSSVLGYLASGKPLSALQVSVTPPQALEATLSSLSLGTAGKLLYALKLLTAHQHARTYWAELVVRELQRHRDKHIEELEKQAQALAGKLAGLAYRPLDMWEHLEEVKEDALAITYVNPPMYERGYDRLYDTGGALQWAEPSFQEFSPKTQHSDLRDHLMEFAGLAVFVRQQRIEEAESPLVIFASEHSLERTDYLLTNKPDVVAHAFAPAAHAFKPIGVRSASYPIFGEGDEVGPGSEIRFVSCPAQVGLYYRDLWAHRLPTTNADAHYLVLLDTPAAVRFLSCEPLLGVLDVTPYLGWDGCYAGEVCPDHARISWVIVGGESGPGSAERKLVERCTDERHEERWHATGDVAFRCDECQSTGWRPKPQALEWVRSIHDQCVAAGVPFFFKQFGGPKPSSAGALIDGRTWDEMPEAPARAPRSGSPR